MSKEISLAREYPTEGLSPVMAKSDSGPDYPSFHYSGKKELDLPDEGEMVVKFRKKRETTETAKDGTHFYECDIEVQSISRVEDDDEPEAPARGSDRGVSDILDSLMEKHMESKKV